MNNNHLTRIIKEITKFTVDELKNKGLISLYLSGTILTKDRVEYSDIDLFGIVPPDFNIIEEENKINSEFKKRRKTLCGGFETRFRAIGTDELNKGKLRGIMAKYIGLNILIKEFPFFKKLWGGDLDFSKFRVKPIKPKEEAKIYIKTIENFMKKLKKGEELFPIQNFPKSILYLVRVEAEKDYNFKFNPYYVDLEKHLAKQKDHIVHKAMKLRHKKLKRKDILDFEEDIKKYLKYMKKRVKEWK